MATVAIGADNQQTITAFAEAATHKGPSLVIAYGTCIAHGIEMRTAPLHQRDAVASGYWPLYRYDPRREQAGEPAMRLDSRKPSIPVEQFEASETRFTSLQQSRPDDATRLRQEEQEDPTSAGDSMRRWRRGIPSRRRLGPLGRMAWARTRSSH